MAAIFLRFVTYVGALLVAGMAAFGAFQPMGTEGRARLARRTAAVAALFVLSAFVSVFAQVSELLGTGAGASLSSVALFLRVTALGRSWAWRIGLTALAGALLAAAGASRRWVWRVSSAAALGALFPVASVSHAAGAVDLRWLFVLIDWVHLASVGLWFGGLAVLGFLRPAASPREYSRQLDRFSSAAMVWVPVAVASGAFQMQNTLEVANDLVTFDYGQALVAKHLFLVPVLALAGYTMLVVKPRLAVRPSWALMRQAEQNVRAEWVLVLGMLASTAFFSREVPPSHVGMAGPDVLKSFVPASDPAFFLWGAVATAAFAFLVRSLLLRASWPVTSAAGAVFALALFMAIASWIVVLDTPVFRHSADPAVVALGRKVYYEHCSVCHGERGKGDGPGAAGLNPPPADLTAEHFFHHSDHRLLEWVTHGIPGSAMPAFRDRLTLEERQAVISFIRQLGMGAWQGDRE